MQTAVQKIIEQIDEEVQVLSNLYGSEIKGRLIALAFAKKRCLEMLEMEKQQIIDAYKFGLSDEYVIGSEQYYTSTYGSKGSDLTSSQTEISGEEIKKASIERVKTRLEDAELNIAAADGLGFMIGAEWYREQLKQL